ncbi:MAG: protein kinase [Thermoanaerobaculia bacterium]
MIGATLSHFRIAAKLGEGGMGKVYRAEDTKLGREVAIKVLPEAVATDPERLARFEREARVLAALDHPNIASIYSLESAEVADVGEGGTQGSVVFLVMQLAEGEDLTERITRGPIPVEEAMPIALQIAEALEAAHKTGIIHRDLKPANIKVTPEGQVKILDFGLAKALDPISGSGADRISVSLSPTLTEQMTQAGVLLGTAAYMSPEQARGQEVDKQADIWAFGVVLFEMLSGRMAFPGATVTDVMAGVVAREPDWDAVPTNSPWQVKELLRLCLTKDPRQRVHDIADARLMLTSSAAPTTEIVPAPGAKTWRRILPWGLAAILAVIAGALTLSSRNPDSTPGPIQRFSITLPPELHLAADEQIVLSPDGSTLLITGFEDQTRKLFLRQLKETDVEVIPETEGARNPFFSPDGQSIGFTRHQEEVVTLSLSTGREAVIADAGWGGGSWSTDDTIVFTPNYTSGLHRIPASGGVPEELTRPDLEQGELGHFWPQHLPDGNAVVFTSFSVPLSRASIDVYDFATGEHRTLVENGVWGRYVPTGHLVFIRDKTMMAVRFDLEKLETTGAPVSVLTDLMPELGQGDTPITFSSNGTLAYVPAAVMNPQLQLTWVDRQGNETPFAKPNRYQHPKISPDGRRIALTIEDTTWDLWALEVERGTLSRLSFEANTQFGALWMPSGDRIIYSQDDPPYNLYWRSADGSGDAEPLVKSAYDSEARSISPDGKLLVYSENHHETGSDLWLVPLAADHQPRAWLQTPFNEDFAAFSPDGRWIAYNSDVTGKTEVFISRFPEGDRKFQVSLEGGSRPLWSQDGRELFYRDGNRMMAVNVTTSDRVSADEPRELFTGSYLATDNKWDYDVAPDGRFIMIKTPDEKKPREITVVLNWFQELESLAPDN